MHWPDITPPVNKDKFFLSFIAFVCFWGAILMMYLNGQNKKEADRQGITVEQLHEKRKIAVMDAEWERTRSQREHDQKVLKTMRDAWNNPRP